MTEKLTNNEPTYENDGKGNFTQKGWLDRERDRAKELNKTATKTNWGDYLENWKLQLTGFAFPQVPIKNEEDMQLFVSELITAIAKMFSHLDGKPIGWKYEVAKMGFNLAQNFMGELGY